VNFLPLDVAEGLATPDLAHASLTALLARRPGLEISHATQRFNARSARGRVANMLQVKPGTAMLYAETVMYSGSRPVSFSEVHYRPEFTYITAVLTSIAANGSGSIGFKSSAAGQTDRVASHRANRRRTP
jgi:DNA-binding GntR family transcriptional regulator